MLSTEEKKRSIPPAAETPGGIHLIQMNPLEAELPKTKINVHR